MHIHKAGGSSVEASLDQVVKWNDIVLGAQNFDESMEAAFEARFNLHKHSSAQHIRSIIGTEIWESYTTWTTVRNPYDRVVSLYCYIASLIEPLLEEKIAARHMAAGDIANWMESDEYPTNGPWDYPASKAYVASKVEARHFSAFIRSPHMPEEPAYFSQFSQVADSETDQIIVKEIVKLETLSESWPDICAEMNIPAVPLVIRNETPRQFKIPTVQLLADPGDRHYLAEVFGCDFDNFGYKTDFSDY